ncbi:MAG: hypothetical protein HC844_19130 [Tabrizicola sp.]|nr:hypothetical protein [Tabrizicola sp.]
MKNPKLPLQMRLHALETASLFTAGGRRIIADAASGVQLAAVLHELNETVLGRTLHIDNDGGKSFAVEVAGRRVLRVTSVEAVADPFDWSGVDALDESHRDELIRLIAAVASPGAEVRVAISALSVANDGSSKGLNVGVPVAALAEAVKVDLNSPPTAAEPVEAPIEEPVDEDAAVGETGFLDRMVSGLGPILVAWIARAPETEDRLFGPEEMVSHLAEFLDDEGEALVEQMDKLSPGKADPLCHVLGATMVEGHCVISLRADGAVLLGVIEGDATAGLLQAWNAAR